MAVQNNRSRLERAYRLRPGNSLHLGQICSRMAGLRVREPVARLHIVGQQQQALAVGVKSAGGIDAGGQAGNIAKTLPARPGRPRELRQHPVWLVE
jgi:hypothetical protein